MGVIYSRGCKHIPGYKELTTGKEIKVLKSPKLVYFPTLSGNGKEITLEVKVGDTVNKGTRLGIGQGFYVPYYSSISGKVIGIEKRFNSLVGRPIDHLVIENDFKNTEKYSLKKYDFDKVTREQIVEGIKEAGIVGLGGAGFPTYVKYGAESIHTIIINACECEPFITTDYEVILKRTREMFEGAELLRRAANAEKVVICVKKTKIRLIDALNVIAVSYKNIFVKPVKDVYPAGWERTLIWNVTKKDYDKLPSELGIIVNNAQTCIAVYDAIINGKPIVERTITVSGNAVKEPTNIVVPIGTPACEIIEACGGYTSDQVLLIPGGPMCGKAQMNDQFVTEKQTGALTVLEYKDVKEEPCWHCGTCTLHCPASLQPCEIKRAVEAKDVDAMIKLKAQTCIECGMCAYVCPSHINVTEAIRKAKLQLKIAAAKAAAGNK